MKRKDAAVEYGHIGGLIGGGATSAAKRRAVKANGKLGGRPRVLLPCVRCGAKTRERDASRRADCGSH